MVDPAQIGSKFRISHSDEMGDFAPLKSLSEHALAQGYTDLRFDQKTMGWAYHRPDQAIGGDGRLYVKVAKS